MKFIKESRKMQPILFVNKTELGAEWLITRYEDALPLLKRQSLKKRSGQCIFSRYIKCVSYC